ncbi:MAG TPA: glycosyltransferase family 39 protein [Solirubrobacteraceae bacterium]|jgi:4-amino-4-deoxy-L-arabinose transferase-like glycosyltransferase
MSTSPPRHPDPDSAGIEPASAQSKPLDSAADPVSVMPTETSAPEIAPATMDPNLAEPPTPAAPPPLAPPPVGPSPNGARAAPRAPRTARGPMLPDLQGVLGYLALVPILALSAVLNTHRLAQNSYANVFYSAGVKSMLGSFHNFFFASFDPGGLVTVDKPPLALWVQALSAKLFGFSPLSLLLPNAIIGVIGVALLYLIMRRPFGQLAALVGALTLAVFPAYVASSRDNGVDLVLILLMLLAAGAALRAIRTGGWPSLLASAVFVGLAFNTKTLAAYLVVPGIALAYLACAPSSFPRRLLKLLVAGVLMGAVSFAWIAYVEATPASQRPYVGGSTDNTETGLTFDYNGFGRVEGEVGGPGEIFIRLGGVAPFNPANFKSTPTTTHLTEKRTRAPKATVVTPNPILPNGHYANPTPFGVPPGPLRLWEAGLGDQGGWMLPFALFGMLAIALAVLLELRWPAKKPATAPASGDAPDGAAAVTQPATNDAPDDAAAATQRAATKPSSQTPSATPPPPSWWQRLRRDPRTAGLIVLGGWCLTEAVILSFSKGIVHPYYVSALGPGTAAMVGGGAAALVGFARRRNPLVLLAPLAVAATVAGQIVLLRRAHYMHWWHQPLAIAAAAGVLVLFLALLVRRAAWPAMVATLAALVVAPLVYSSTTWSVPVEGTFPAAGPKVAGALGPYGVTAHDVKVDRDLMAYIDTHGPTRRWELLTVSSNTSATPILLGYRAGALGGYSGTDPAVDGPQLARMVANHEARYVVLGGAYASRGGNAATHAVIKACREIPNEAWLHFRRYSVYSLVLYDCAGRERELAAQP